MLLAAPEAGPMYGVLIRAVSLQLALLEGRKRREPSLQSLSTRSGFTKAHPKAIPEVIIRGRQTLTSRGYQDINRFFGMRRVRK